MAHRPQSCAGDDQPAVEHEAGRGYRCGRIQAVVLAGAKEIKFCDEKGALLTLVSLEDTEKKEATCDRSKEQ